MSMVKNLRNIRDFSIRRFLKKKMSDGHVLNVEEPFVLIKDLVSGVEKRDDP